VRGQEAPRGLAALALPDRDEARDERREDRAAKRGRDEERNGQRQEEGIERVAGAEPRRDDQLLDERDRANDAGGHAGTREHRGETGRGCLHGAAQATIAPMQRIVRLLRAWRSAQHPVRFAISRLLFHSGISPLFKMSRGGIVYRFWPSSMSMTLWADPGYAAEDREIVRTVVRPGDTVVDVGANIGFVALEAAAAAGPGGSVIAYEPHPRVFRFLSGNAALNPFPHLDLRGRAVGERAGSARITDGVADDQNRVSSDGAGVDVPLVTLDDDLPPGPIRLLKIDVEGFEVPVLRGAAGALQRTSWIYVEVAEAHQARFGHAAAELLGLLSASGFELWTRGATGPFVRLQPEPVADGCINVLGFRRTSGRPPLPGATAPLVELARAGS